MDLSQDLQIRKWLESSNFTDATKKNYLISIRNYLEVTDQTPRSLIEEACQEQDNKVPLSSRTLLLYLIKYKMKLEETKSPTTVHLYVSAVKSFYQHYHVQLPELSIEVERTVKKPLARQDLQRLISVSKPRERAIIYIMALSGMDPDQIINFKITEFLQAASNEIGISLEQVTDLFKNEAKLLKHTIPLPLTSKRNKYNYYTFFHPQVTHQILIYLQERYFGSNNNIRINSKYQPIFLSVMGKILTKDAMSTNLRRNFKKVGINRDKKLLRTSQAILKYFTDTVAYRSENKYISKYLRGHKLEKRHIDYFNHNLEEIRELYLQTFPFLTLD